MDHTTVDQRGETHRTRTFRVENLTATNVDGTTCTLSGGAEMLTWNTQIGQTPGVASRSTHAGTLVIDPTDGGPRVIAHLRIQFVQNAQGEIVVDFHSWRCRTSRS